MDWLFMPHTVRNILIGILTDGDVVQLLFRLSDCCRKRKIIMISHRLYVVYK